MAEFNVPVSDYMNHPVLTVDASTPLNDVSAIMGENDVSALIVVSAEGRVEGLVTHTDLLRLGTHDAQAHQDPRLLSFPQGSTVRDAMSTEVESVTPQTSLAEAAAIMAKKRFHRLVVLESGKLCGVLSPFDLMRALVHRRQSRPVSEFMSSPLISVQVDLPIADATDRFERAHVSGLVVLEGEYLVGLFTQREAIAAQKHDRDTPVEAVMSPALVVVDQGVAMHRACWMALNQGARRIVTTDNGRPVGILSGIDIAKAVAR